MHLLTLEVTYWSVLAALESNQILQSKSMKEKREVRRSTDTSFVIVAVANLSEGSQLNWMTMSI